MTPSQKPQDGGAAFQSLLHCDAPDCNHVERVAEVTADLIGKPCPRCGASLLTEEDFEASRGMFAMAKILDSLGLLADPATADENSVSMSVRHHDGQTTIKISEPNGGDA